MAANNYFGFTSGGTQYGASPSYQTGQATTAYAIQHAPAANPQPYAAAPRPSAPASYEAAPAYQQPAHSNTSYPYAATAAAAPVRQPTTYDQKPQAYYQQATAAPAASTPAYSTTETTHYQSPYIQQQQQPQQQQSSTISTIGSSKVQSNSWQGFRKTGAFNKGGGAGGFRAKIPPKPQQLHYCEVCKVSCAGPQTYQEHLEGQKHKKKEIAAKSSNQALPRGSGISLRCELCDVTCTGNDAYTAHIRGIKHQKVVKLHTRLGKPIPATDPVVVSDAKSDKKEGTSPSKVNVSGKSDTVKDDKEDVQPVGQDYIEEIKNDDGKVINFLCKLCDCHFNDPNAKEMHMKGRRHRLQYKKKVNPELVVDIKPSLRHRKIQEERLRRHLQEEFWKRKEEEHWREEMRHMEEQERLYWEDRRRFEEYEWHRRFGPQGPGPLPMMRPGMIPPPGLLGRGFPPGPPIPALRKPESSDDRHVLSKHSQIYPKEEELNLIQKNVTNVEKALKLVSDIISSENEPEAEVKKDEKASSTEGQNGESANRILKGVMRVGMLAKGLLLTGDTSVRLVVMCSEKPTQELLGKVASLLPKQLTAVAEEVKYKVFSDKNSITVRQAEDGKVDININLTSPLMREANLAPTEEGKPETPPVKDPPDVLDRQKCLEALAALRHAKWFQARASGLQSCVIIIRVMRDLCQRVPTWAHLSLWAMELLVEKVLSSAGQPLTPGEALRHVLEAIASGLLLPGGPGLLDPCEKEPIDAAANLTNQEREDITASAQHALRLFAFRQVHKVLGIDPLPPPKHGYSQFPRKRRRDGSVEEGTDGKKGKTDEIQGKMENSTEEVKA